MKSQKEKHELGRKGEKLANGHVNGEITRHKAPFDIVDFDCGYAYEVKSMSGLSMDMKVHISDESMERKVKFAEEYGLSMVLIVVVIYGKDRVEVYRSELVQSIRVCQMDRMED